MRKEIPNIKNGFGHTYEVSDDGFVFNAKTGRQLKGRPQKKGGYLRVNLAGKDYKVHRLVAMAFIENPENKEQVNHINGDTADNRVENLQWSTASENIKHAYDNGLMSNVGEKNRNSFLSEKDILEIRASDLPYQELAEKYETSKGYIQRIRSKDVWKHI